MTLLEDTLTTAADLGRAAASQATGAATIAGRGITDAAHLGQAALDEFGDAVSGSDRNRGRRIMVLAVVAAIAGFIIWRRRSARHEPEQSSTATTPGTPSVGPATTPEMAVRPNVDSAARTNAGS